MQAGRGEIESTQATIVELEQKIADKQTELASIEQKKAAVEAEFNRVQEVLKSLTLSGGGGGGGGGGAPCFAYDTLVFMADNSLKRIGDVQVGEKVQAYDVETGQIIIADVIATGNGEASYYYLINGNLKVTPPHPFFTADGKWTKVEDLKAGDDIRSCEGVVETVSIEKVNSGQQIFNISVRSFHNFFVSANGRDFYLVKES